MLNRKLTNYIFQGSLVLIIGLVLLIRSVVLGDINEKIDDVDFENRILQRQIDILELQVEENKNKQSDHLYELYNRVPSYYKVEDIEFKVYSMLYAIGLEYQNIYESDLNIEEYSMAQERFAGITNDFEVKLVSLTFNTNTLEDIEELLDDLYLSEQIYIVETLRFEMPDVTGFDYPAVTIEFLAFYNIEKGN